VTASATSRASTGDVRPVPKGSRIVASRAIDSAAQARKKKFCRNTVARTCTTGSPDQFAAHRNVHPHVGQARELAGRVGEAFRQSCDQLRLDGLLPL